MSLPTLTDLIGFAAGLLLALSFLPQVLLSQDKA
jgi:uncharacterized protein with PQ loop repeat